MTRNPALEAAFTDRMIDGLVANNVLRGSWAEQVVANCLGDGVEFADQWNYFDFRWNAAKVSVKHSVNRTARFDIARRSMAWDAELASQRQPRPYTEKNHEGWLGHEKWVRQHWCDLYVFAWLPDASTIEHILNPAEWQFAALSRAHIYEHFPENAKSVGLATFATIGLDFVAGADLIAVATDRLRYTPAPSVIVPPLDQRTRETIAAELVGVTEVEGMR